VSRTVLRDAITNAIYFVIGTVVIIVVGHQSRTLGLVLAGIETLFAAIQSLKVLFIIVADIVLFFATRFGKRRREPDEAEMRVATLIRTVELGIWGTCIFVLYRFFFG